ncbi:MAG: divalent metal cation transporter [bacterium]
MVSAAFIPRLQWNTAYIGIIVAILGTTISPYLFVWEASMEVEEDKEERREVATHHEQLPVMRRRVHLMQK